MKAKENESRLYGLSFFVPFYNGGRDRLGSINLPLSIRKKSLKSLARCAIIGSVAGEPLCGRLCIGAFPSALTLINRGFRGNILYKEISYVYLKASRKNDRCDR